MNSTSWSARLPPINPVRAFLTVFLAVFLFIFLGSALVTFMLPESYRATALVLVPDGMDAHQFASEELLREVSHQLNLPERLAARYGEHEPLADQRVENLLRRSVQVRRLRGTNILQIMVYSRSPEESAELANTIARQARHRSSAVRLLDRAEPPLRPSRPNKPLNLALGAIVGVFLGIMAGGVGAKLAVGFDVDPVPRPP